MKYFALTDIGTRYSNEDSCLIQELPNNQVLAAVIDGCGAAGGVAHIFRDRLRNELDALTAITPEGISVNQLKSVVINLNNYMSEFRIRFANIGCFVLTACLINRTTLDIDIVHCGDCRAYHFSDDLCQITIDDSYVGHLLYSGGITESDARNHPMRHQIFKSLGHELLMGDDNYISTYKRSASIGDYILLTTDGVYDTLRQYEIKSILRRDDLTVEDKLNTLITLARENGSTDNATALIIKL